MPKIWIRKALGWIFAMLSKTRKSCCHSELPHMYRKLASNTRATQWIETIGLLKLSANMGSCQKTTTSAYFYFRSSSPTELESVSHVSSLKIFTNCPLLSYSFVAADTLRDLVTMTFVLLTLVSGHTVHGGLRGQPLHQVWRSYGYPFLNYEFWHLP